MTLILTIANTSGVYQSSDYQLTDDKTGTPVSDRAGSKQLQASFRDLDLRLAFTGVAIGRLGGPRTVDLLSQELQALPQNSKLQDVCEALAKRCDAITRRLGPRGILEVVVTAATVAEPFRVAIVTNANWDKEPPRAKFPFRISIHTVRKPFYLISGFRKSVPARQRHRLRALARAEEKSPVEVMNALADINSTASKHGRGYVSKDCWTTSQTADGRLRRSAGLNVGQHPGSIPSLVGGLDLNEWVRTHFRTAPGKEISIVQSAGVISGPGDGVPIPPPSGPPRTFRLSGSSITVVLVSPAGEPCASVEITQLESLVEARLNEEITVPFAKISLKAIHPVRSPFPKPLFPWPQACLDLVIDDAMVPRGWEYSIGHWIELDSLRLVIPLSSRSIRSIAFLGPDDELVVVAPSESLEFVWEPNTAGPSATVQARVWWRSRLDGTHG